MRRRTDKQTIQKRRKAIVAVAGILASATTDTALASVQRDEAQVPVLQTPEQIDAALSQLRPGALRRLLQRLKIEETVRFAGPLHDTHSATTFGNHSSSPQ
jgi:hypothetical protein